MTIEFFTDISPVFIVGASRSGTTLLQLILNAHPDITVCGELTYFQTIAQLKKKLPVLESPEHVDKLISYVNKIFNVQYLPDFNNVIDSVQHRLKAERVKTYEKYYRYLLEEYAHQSGVKRFGEKTPENIRYLDEITNIFPKCKIIHIIRDPRAVVASLVRMKWATDDVVINALKWKVDILYSQEYKKNSSNYFEIYYEDLVSNPKELIVKVCEFLEEKFDNKMLDFHKTSKNYIKDEPWKEGTFQQINKSAVGKWTNELSGAQVFVIEFIVGSLLSKLGYKKAEISKWHKLILPLTFCVEILKFLKCKVNEILSRKQDYSDMIFGENKRLYQNLLKAFIYR